MQLVTFSIMSLMARSTWARVGYNVTFCVGKSFTANSCLGDSTAAMFGKLAGDHGNSNGDGDLPNATLREKSAFVD